MIMRARAMAVGLAICCAAGACSSGSSTKSTVTTGDAGSARFSIVDAVRQLPASLDADNIQIVVGDLDAATAAAGLTRPDVGDGVDVDAVEAWLTPLTGVQKEGAPAVAVNLPTTVHVEQLRKIDEFDAELGWSLADVSWFVEYQVPPDVFAVFGGSFSEKDIDDAVDDRDGDVWKIGSDDLGHDLEQRSAARPRGESLRMALRDGELAVGRKTAPVEQWADGDAERLAGEDVLDVAAALDAAGVYTATIVAAGGAPSPAYEALGIGLGLDDGTATATFVYRFADEAAAQDHVGRLEELLRDGSSAATDRPWAEVFTVRAVRAEGPLLIAQLELEDIRPLSLMQIVFARDNIVTFDAAG